MIALVLCVVALAATFFAARRSLGAGIVALLAVGYFYGLLRANLLTTFSHFIFDAGLLGLYLGKMPFASDPADARRMDVLRIATALLLAWPFLLVLMPFQPLLISLVGLRGNILFIPLLLLGAHLKKADLLKIASGLAALNLIALAFALAEYSMGLQRFYPVSPVTMLIYISRDAGEGFFRIPAIFTSAHAFGGTLVCSLPFLVGGWQQGLTNKSRLLALLGIGAALLGILMSATRQNFILGCAVVLAITFTTRLSARNRIVLALLVAAVGIAAATNVRFQRFKTLGDTEAVTDRIAGSVNRDFFEILQEYPMGNGLGGGGTSIPYFLEGQVRNPIGMENEYSRILSEQGIIGLLLWLGFIAWFMSRFRHIFSKAETSHSRRIAWCLAAFFLGTAWIGRGLLTSIPQTLLLILSVGWTAVLAAPETAPRRQVRLKKPAARELTYAR